VEFADRGTAVAFSSLVSRPCNHACDRLSNSKARSEATRAEESMDLMNRMRAFVRGEEGQDLLEYALLVALIALVAIVGVTAAGVKVNTIFSNIAAAL